MGFFDKKSTKNTTNNEYNTDNSSSSVDNSVIEAGDASTVLSVENIKGDVTLTDNGAIEKSMGLARGALDYSSNVLANAFTFGDEVSKNSLIFGESALDLAKNSNQLMKDYGLNLADRQVEATKNSLNFASDALEKTSGIANSAVSKISEVVKGANTSDSVQTIKYIGIAVVGVVLALFVLPQLIKKG